MLKKIFNGLEYKIETIEDYLTDIEIKYMTGYVKEVKKVKKKVDYRNLPYFQMQVVMVKKAVCHHDEVTYKNGTFKCKHCGQILRIKRYDKNKRWGFIRDELQPLGNWVNGENLDKIKFPCLCRFNNKHTCRSGYGMVNFKYCNNEIIEYKFTELKQIKAGYVQGRDMTYNSLKKLIEDYDIHILKGKIIIFEEE